MNAKRLTVLTLILAFLAYGSSLFSSDKVESLRGGNAIDQVSAVPADKEWMGKTGRIARNFDQQPPLIPHKSQAHKIDLEGNRCLSCHGLENYEKRKAVRMSDSHYRDREGNQLKEVSSARYFCTQCHVEQRNAEPLVANEFKANHKAN
jgi:cytochrome c-type protein NapB